MTTQSFSLEEWMKAPRIERGLFSKIGIVTPYWMDEHLRSPKYRNFFRDYVIPSMTTDEITQYGSLFREKDIVEKIFATNSDFRELKESLQMSLTDVYYQSVENKSIDEIFADYPLIVRVLRLGENDPNTVMDAFIRHLFPARRESNDREIMIRSVTQYPISLRARNDMLFIPKKSPTGVEPKKILYPTKYLPIYRTYVMDEYVAFPVTRYVNKYGHGLFWGHSYTDEMDICGTFYYYEPGSINYLVANRVLFSPNRSFALFALATRQEFNDIYDKDYHGVYPGNEWMDEIIDAIEPLYPDISDNDSYTIQKLYIDAWESRKIERSLGTLIDSEMSLDEDICALARAQGIDLVVFGALHESQTLSGEILDVRGRDVTFNYIYRL